MKKSFFAVAIIGCIACHNAVYAAECVANACDPDDLGYMDINPFASNNCSNPGATCYCGERVLSCPFCSSGYTRTQDSVALSSGGSAKYYYCKENCTGCSNCTSDTSWSSAGTGYEKKVTRTCNCNTCNTSTSYRCAAGYYGSSSNGTSGCTRCPSSGNSAAGSTSATGCYITSGSDGTGSFTYTQNCYYK